MCSSMEGWKSVQTTEQPIKLSSTAVKDLFQGERPPPKPPPPNHTSVTAPTSPDPSSIRPPLKPPWFCCGLVYFTVSCFRFTVVMFDGVFLCCSCVMYCYFCSCFCFVMVAHKLFVKMPQGCWTFWTRVMRADLKVAANNLYLFSTKQMDSKLVFSLTNFETTYSRFVLAEVKEMILNGIDKKTVDLLFSFVNDHLRKKLVWVIGFRYWFAKPLLIYVISNCNVVQTLAYLAMCATFNVFNVLLRNVSTHCVLIFCNALCFNQ